MVVLLGLLAVPSPFLGVDVVATIALDPSWRAGSDGEGRLLLYAPDPLQPGSSISHWDASARPDLLMEPSVGPGLGGDLDLTTLAMLDLGWPTGAGATLEIVYEDNPGTGFYDASLGADRRAALRRAADTWEANLSSSVTIVLEASFTSLVCAPGIGATLAMAGAKQAFKFEGSPQPDTWYQSALAEAITGLDLSGAVNEMQVAFNSAIDQGCLGPGTVFDYGSEVPAAGAISFERVALHELGHGLGFANLIDESTGAKFQGDPDAFSWLTRDAVFEASWAELTAEQIVVSATRTGEVAWSGDHVSNGLESVLEPQPVLGIDTVLGARKFPVGVATFGPSPSEAAVDAPLVEATDGTPQGSLLCGPVANVEAVSGAIALVDRGDCLFVDKVSNAQAAGAVGVVVVNNVAGRITMGGVDPDIEIPAVMVSPEDGATLRSALATPYEIFLDGFESNGTSAWGQPP